MPPRDLPHLLIIDDDNLLRGMAAGTLRYAGFVVSEAPSGEDALPKFETNRFDLVLLDVVMPGIDGYEVCKRIRATAAGARVPIIMLSGLNDTASIELAYVNGATDFITKPINWTLLSHKVRYALRASADADAMRRGRERLARAQGLAGMGNWTLAADGIMAVSTELLRLLGLPDAVDAVLSFESALELVVAADRETVRHARIQLLEEGTPYQLSFSLRRADGALRMMFEQAARAEDVSVIEGITQDITDRVQAQERIQQLAHYDAITGLPNRQLFAEMAGPSLERASRNATGCAVLHLDIDRFKEVNDTFGRNQGDVLLKSIADRLRSWTRNSDLTAVDQLSPDRGVLASVGGNAFSLLITDLVDQEHAAVVAQRLLKAIAEPIVVESQSLVLTVSIGVAFFPDDARDLPGLSRCAEQALHAAKKAGRANYRFFDEQMNVRAAKRFLMEAELRRAIEHSQLRLHFQPKVDAGNGAITGAEALVRWQHPERGMVSPGEFIKLAEDTGLIFPLTDWVLERACQSLQEWSQQGLPEIPLSVNLAAPSLSGTALLGKLDALMGRFNLLPRRLILEMTETILMQDVESAIALLKVLRATGYGLSLDDFGTGYSSLNYLKRLPLDELKIDRAFVTDAARGGRDGALAATIIALGRELGLQVVAEGVETREQSAFLLQRGCNIQQGYLFCRPVPGGQFATLLARGFIEHEKALNLG